MTTANITVGASSYQETKWHSINWDGAHRLVRRLQVRIAKAISQGRWNKAKALQRLLTHSFYSKAVAVKRVTENHGKKTPGWLGQPGMHRNKRERYMCKRHKN